MLGPAGLPALVAGLGSLRWAQRPHRAQRASGTALPAAAGYLRPALPLLLCPACLPWGVHHCRCLEYQLHTTTAYEQNGSLKDAPLL